MWWSCTPQAARWLSSGAPKAEGVKVVVIRSDLELKAGNFSVGADVNSIGGVASLVSAGSADAAGGGSSGVAALVTDGVDAGAEMADAVERIKGRRPCPCPCPCPCLWGFVDSMMPGFVGSMACGNV